jgi:exosortase
MSVAENTTARRTTMDLSRNRPTLALLAALLVLYVPVIVDVAQVWSTDDNTSYGALVPFMVGLLVWWKREELAALLPARPATVGFVPLVCGLLLEMLAWYTHIRMFAMVSLVPVLLGLSLLLGGKRITRLLLFPILFMSFAAPIPFWLVQPVSVPIQTISARAASATAQELGVPLVLSGFTVSLANGTSVEVAEECSGFKKTLTVTVMAIFYASLFAVPLWKQVALVLLAGPLAVLANIVRVTALILVGNEWGIGGVHAVHGMADPFVVVLCFMLLYAGGRAIGCQKIRYTV